MTRIAHRPINPLTVGKENLFEELMKGAIINSTEITIESLYLLGFSHWQSNIPNLYRLSIGFDKQFRWDSVDGFSIETKGSGFMWPLKNILYIEQIQELHFLLTGTHLPHGW